jgi:predicted TIM-barrel fold metal-dependent hydrolase
MQRPVVSHLIRGLPVLLLLACAWMFFRPQNSHSPEASTSADAPPMERTIIDPHVHAMSVTPLGLRAVAQWMQERDIGHCIVSPLNHKGSRPQSEEERLTMLEYFKAYRGRIHRMAIIQPEEVESVDQAVEILQREIADGAIGFGEHYGVGLMFDDPKNLRLYEACEKVSLPVMFHIDQNKNMVEPGMTRVDRVLKMFPKCDLVAHAYWWRQWASGACDRQLAEHPNLYADMSGAVVVQVLEKDLQKAREFVLRHQDKILWATDEGWWSFQNKDRQMKRHYTFLEELDLPREVLDKLYFRNAAKVYRIDAAGAGR